MDEKIKVQKPLPSPVAIVGMGVSGRAAFQLLLLMGYARQELATFDQAPDSGADYSSAAQLLADFRPKSLIVSPGVPLSTAWITAFSNSGSVVSSELSLALSVLTTEKIIGVTGSLGKSTTVSILSAGLSSFSDSGFVGGNLGLPLASYACQRLGGRKAADWIILELSSYQLENCEDLNCDLSAITFLTPNHLERYPSLQKYYQQKWVLAERTSRSLVLNSNGGDLTPTLVKTLPALKEGAEILWTSKEDPTLGNHQLSPCSLLGEHNQDNLALAFKLAEKAGWPESAFTAMRLFPGLPHRLENLGYKNQVLYVNDSKATTMQSVLTAVRSIRGTTKGTVHLLLGGKDKDLPWQELVALSSFQPIKFYFFGACGALAKSKSGLDGPTAKSLEGALRLSQKGTSPGDLILLSPGGTSLDEFKNFEARGDFFRALFNNHI